MIEPGIWNPHLRQHQEGHPKQKRVHNVLHSAAEFALPATMV